MLLFVVVRRGGPVQVSLPSDGDDIEHRNDAADGMFYLCGLISMTNISYHITCYSAPHL